MAKKKKRRNKNTTTHITIVLPEEGPIEYVSQADTFIYHFVKTIHYWVIAFIGLAIVGAILGQIFILAKLLELNGKEELSCLQVPFFKILKKFLNQALISFN